MTTANLLELLQTDDVREMLRDLIVDLVKTDSEIRDSVVAVLQEECLFTLDCSSSRDYYSEWYDFSLTIDGKRVTSTSFSVSTSS